MKSPAKSGTQAALALLTIALTAHAAEPRPPWDAPPPPKGFPRFKVQEIAADFKIGYAVHICDVDGDRKPDIVVVDKERVVWYQNPTWKMRTITAGKAKPDNVCICSLDIDGDGKVDFVLGAGWKPFDTKTPGTLQWLRRKANLDDEWEMFPIPCDEPTVHRVCVAALEPGEPPAVILAPLMGRDSTKDKNWTDGKPVRVTMYKVPKAPTRQSDWQPQVLSEELHVAHNLCLFNVFGRSAMLISSYEGVSILEKAKGTFKRTSYHPAEQTNRKGNRGSSEVAWGEGLKYSVIGSIEPWHGNQVVAYPFAERDGNQFKRIVIDSQLRWGHAIKCTDLFENHAPFIIAGVRDNPDPKQGDTFTEKRGVRLYRCTDGKGEKWDRYILEDGGVAVEDLQVQDLDGDGKPDIVAVGRATGNCRIYWNQGE